MDEDGLLFFCPRSTPTDDRTRMIRLVKPELLQKDVLHHFHTSPEGGHQGISQTYQRIRAWFHWRGLYKSVQSYTGDCTDCEKGKGSISACGLSPCNVQASYSFQMMAMDHIPSMLRSLKETQSCCCKWVFSRGMSLSRQVGSDPLKTLPKVVKNVCSGDLAKAK